MNVNLLDFDSKRLSGFVAELGEKPFRARQLMRWIHQCGEADFAGMSDLAKSLREKLAGRAFVAPPRVISDSVSNDGTRKWLLDVGNGNAVESVFIPESGRGTLCISSQAGCTLACRFCSTGRQGFNRNLTVAEIIGQLWWANRALGAAPKGERQISNVVLMGMGEPLLNYDNVLAALGLMLDDNAYGLSRRRVTVSTSGIVPLIDRLRDDCPVALAVSLHAPEDELRTRLMPINRKYPLRDLLAACARYLDRTAGPGGEPPRQEPPGQGDGETRPGESLPGPGAASHGYRPGAPRDFITFEYVMLDGVNDTRRHARQLVALLAELSCKVNLIPFNPFPNSGFSRSPAEAIRRFGDTLNAAGIFTTVRRTRGEDIDAACGQLAGLVHDRTRRTVGIARNA